MPQPKRRPDSRDHRMQKPLKPSEPGSSQTSSETSDQGQPMTPSQYRQHVMQTTAAALGILSIEFQTYANQENPDFLILQGFETAIFMLTNLQAMAQMQEQPELLVPEPGLIGPDGKPLTSPKSQSRKAA